MQGIGLSQDQTFFIIIAIALWTIPWKGVALWKAARNGSKVWFAVMLVINTLAILEIIYIFFFSKRRRRVDIKKV